MPTFCARHCTSTSCITTPHIAPTLVAMPGISSMAEPQLQRDEDNLGHEEETAPKDSLATIYHGLRRRSEAAAEAAMALGQILERMVHSAIRNDTEGLTHWYRTCRELVAKVDEEREQVNE